MHVALVTRKFAPANAGGGEVSVGLLAEWLARLGHRVTVLAVEAGSPTESGGSLEVRRIPSLATGAVRAALRDVRPDVAHSYNMETAPATVLAAKSLRVPVVVTVNSAWATCLFADMYRPGHGICDTCTVSGVKQCFERRPPETVGRRVPAVVGWGEVQRRLLVLRQANRLVVLSEAAKDMLVRNGVPERLVRVVPNMASRAFDVTPAPVGERILYVGAITFPKGVDVLVDAFARLAERRPDARLTLAGAGWFEPELRRLAKERGVEDRVEFLGYVPNKELPSLYARSSAVAFPIRSEEAFGRVILEAWGAGVPVVASAVSAPPTIIRDEENGLLVPPEDAAALADALERVLSDAKLAERLVAGGRAALPEYAPERVLPRLLSIYEEVARA